MVSSLNPPIPNLSRRESRCGTFQTHLPVGLTGGSDLWLPVLPSLPPNFASPLAASPTAPLGHKHQTPPPENGCTGGLGTKRPGDPDALGHTQRHGQGRCRKLSHLATLGGRRARPVGGLPAPASKRASKNETVTSWSREEPSKRSHSGPDAGLPTGRLSRARAQRPAHEARQGLTPPKQPPANPLPPAGALEAAWCVRRRRGRDGAGRHEGAGRTGPRPLPALLGPTGCGTDAVTAPRRGNDLRKWSWFVLWGCNTGARRRETHKYLLGLCVVFSVRHNSHIHSFLRFAKFFCPFFCFNRNFIGGLAMCSKLFTHVETEAPKGCAFSHSSPKTL